eukprot:scaffold79699_cov46-Phaeocystis_antarctica.AAC.1
MSEEQRERELAAAHQHMRLRPLNRAESAARSRQLRTQIGGDEREGGRTRGGPCGTEETQRGVRSSRSEYFGQDVLAEVERQQEATARAVTDFLGGTRRAAIRLFYYLPLAATLGGRRLATGRRRRRCNRGSS